MVTNTTSGVAWALSEITKKESEIADLRAYIRVVQTTNRVDAPTQEQPDNSLFGMGRGRKKRAILTALEHCEHGLRTAEIVAALVSGGITDANTANTSPQLSSYGAGDRPVVTLVDGVWKITKWGRDYLEAWRDAAKTLGAQP